MSIYDPLSVLLDIEPNEELFYKLTKEYPVYIDDPSILREETLKRNSELVTCDKCGVTGNRPNMMRWHFDNCKTYIKQCKECGNEIPRQNVKPHLYNQKIYCGRKCYMKSKVGKPPILMTDEIKHKLSVKAKVRSEELSKRMKKNKVWLKSNRWQN